MATAESAYWPTITLAWRQRVAAFWLLAWPSWLISFVLLMVLTTGWTALGPRTHAEVLAWASALSFLLCQGIFVPRMLRKRYRSFRLEIVRKSGSGTPTLTTAEVARVWLRIVWPQVAFLVAVWFLQFSLADHLNADTIRVIPTLSLWGRILVVGPFGIYSAVPADYPEFRLEALGQRFV
jgi:hypothetical protein